MLERFNESELLALIEDELDSAAARELAARLADDRDALARIRAMKEDRTRLRAMAEVELPTDFIAALEPRLARPMLMETMPFTGDGPGSFRRRHRQAGRRRRVMRFVVAATLMGGLLAGVWTTATILMDRPAREHVAGITPGGDEGAPVLARETNDGAPHSAPAPEDEAWPPADAFVYHRAPLPIGARDRGESKASATSARAVSASGTPRIITAEFALSLVSDDVEASERALGEVITASLQSSSPSFAASHMAFVRNFNDAEATALLARYLPLTLGGNESPSAYWDLTRPPSPSISLEDLTKRRTGQADRLNRLREQRRDDGGDILPSRQLMGRRDLAPSFADQLALSDRGATHAMTIPANQLASVLGAMDAELAYHALRTLGEAAEQGGDGTAHRDEPDRPTLVDQVEALRAARALLAEIDSMGEADVYILLPVVIEEKPKR